MSVQGVVAAGSAGFVDLRSAVLVQEAAHLLTRNEGLMHVGKCSGMHTGVVLWECHGVARR